MRVFFAFLPQLYFTSKYNLYSVKCTGQRIWWALTKVCICLTHMPMKIWNISRTFCCACCLLRNKLWFLKNNLFSFLGYLTRLSCPPLADIQGQDYVKRLFSVASAAWVFHGFLGSDYHWQNYIHSENKMTSPEFLHSQKKTFILLFCRSYGLIYMQGNVF